MNKLLQDNGYALTLGGFCLLVSAWLYTNDVSSPAASTASSTPERAQAQTETETPAARRARRMTAVAAQEAPRQAARRDPSAPGQGREPANEVLAPEFEGLNVSPADWHASPKQ
jgi:hypothetical protein